MNGEKVSEYPVFPNAPITEALLDIRVQLPEDITLQTLETFNYPIKESFSDKQLKVSYQAEIKFSPKGVDSEISSPSGRPEGYLFRSASENKIVQARLDGFTFNKLKPYENWEKLKSEARNLWGLYLKLARPIKITRIALRYINRIEIPLPMEEFKDYILTVPDSPSDLPLKVDHFFMSINCFNDVIQAKAVVNETIEAITADNKLPLIFDIDVYRATNYEGNSDEIWEEFAKLRAFKNDIFFKSITKKTQELFK
jgi:uncharacterized protein (TIGR04255 family)